MKLHRNPYFIFLPFLLFYYVFVFIFQKDTITGDEDRFLLYAQNLTNGYFASPDITIGNGPGYSIFIVPFLILKLPLFLIILTNPILYYLSIVFLFKSIKLIAPFNIALIFSLFWACYYNSLDNMHLMHSEVFSSFLISILLYFLVKAFNPADQGKRKKYLILAGFTFGYLILTKVIFGYVLLFMLIVSAILWLFNRSNLNYKKGTIILLCSFLTVLPYLIYTYNLTGKTFYWSTTGGENLYWMSTNYNDEYGSWIAAPNLPTNYTSPEDSARKAQESGYLIFANKENLLPGLEDSIKLHHQKDFDEILKHSITGLERDKAFTRIAIRNIKADPGNYVKNCFSNVGRILFNYPYTYTRQKPTTLLRLPLNGLIAVLMLFCLIPTFMNWRKVIYPIRFILFMLLLYLGGSVLASAEIRMFTIIVPMPLFWIAYTLTKTVKINLKFKNEVNRGDWLEGQRLNL